MAEVIDLFSARIDRRVAEIEKELRSLEAEMTKALERIGRLDLLEGRTLLGGEPDGLH